MNAQKVCKNLGIESNSVNGQAILKLSKDNLDKLSQIVSSDDYLIHVDQTGFSVNHGNVGTRGIRYEFDRC